MKELRHAISTAMVDERKAGVDNSDDSATEERMGTECVGGCVYAGGRRSEMAGIDMRVGSSTSWIGRHCNGGLSLDVCVGRTEGQSYLVEYVRRMMCAVV